MNGGRWSANGSSRPLVAYPRTLLSRWSHSDGNWLGRVGINSFWLLTARISAQGLGLLSTALLARALGQAGLGQFAFLSAILYIGNAVTTFGLDTLLTREVAATRREPALATLSVVRSAPTGQLVGAGLLMQLFLSALFVGLMWLVAPRLSNQTPDTLRALHILLLALIPLAFTTVFSALLRAHERMDLYLVFTVLTAAGMALGSVGLLLSRGGLAAAAWVVVLAQGGGALAATTLARWRLPTARWRPAWPSSRLVYRLFGQGFGLATLMALSLTYQRSGVLLLSLMAGDEVAGAYSIGARVLEALKLLPVALFGAMFPIMALGGDRGVDRVYRRAFIALLGVTTLAAAGVAILAGPLVVVLFGRHYEAATAALRVMVWSLPGTIIALKLSFDLVVARRERLAALAMALALLAGGGITAMLIGRWSLSGAAYGLVMAEATQVVILYVLTRYGWRKGIGELR